MARSVASTDKWYNSDVMYLLAQIKRIVEEAQTEFKEISEKRRELVNIQHYLNQKP